MPQIQQQSITSMFTSISSNSALRNSFDEQRYRDALIGLLTRRRVAFSAVEWDELKDMMLAGNPAIEDLLITSRRTAVRYIASNYILYREQLKVKLSSARGSIHISTDLWTSPHRSALLAVCAQWVSDNYTIEKALLGLPECRYSHSGEKQAQLILETLETFGIQSQIGYHTGDNASSNDTCLKHLESLLREKHAVEFDAKRRRIRCIAHIINLSLQAFLLASSKEALNAAFAAANDVSGEEFLEQFSEVLESHQQKRRENQASSKAPQSQLTQRHSQTRATRDSQSLVNDDFSGIESIPALSKVHRLCVWLHSSTLHADAWEDAVGLRLGTDNKTRWSSWYQVIDRALGKINDIKLFMLQYAGDLGDICLDNDDWDILGKMHAFLQPFASATLYGEGDRSSISASLKLMDSLLVHYEKNKEHYSQSEHRNPRMLRAIEMGWFVLDKYYTMTEEVPVYASALLLNPSCRVAYLKKNWPREWHEPAIAAARRVWDLDFKNRLPPERPTSSDIMPPPSKRRGVVLGQLFESMEAITSDSRTIDDFMTFIEQPTFRIDCTPFEWWCREEQRQRYPRLSQMALEILSIPPESSEPERTFSGSRRTCSWDRSRLTCLNIQRIECIGNWRREGHIQPVSANGQGMCMEPMPEGELEEIDDDSIDLIEWL
jgi:hypothetical protein